MDGPSNSPVAHHSLSTGFDISSLSKRSELSPEDDARDLGELIMALKGNFPTAHYQLFS